MARAEDSLMMMRVAAGGGPPRPATVGAASAGLPSKPGAAVSGTEIRG